MGTVILVTIVVAGVVITVLIIDAAVRQFRSTRPLPCRLVRAFILRDVCAGACVRGSCTAVTTRRYGFFGGRQAATCGCVTAAPGGGSAGGNESEEPEDQ